MTVDRFDLAVAVVVLVADVESPARRTAIAARRRHRPSCSRPSFHCRRPSSRRSGTAASRLSGSLGCASLSLYWIEKASGSIGHPGSACRTGRHRSPGRPSWPARAPCPSSAAAGRRRSLPARRSSKSAVDGFSAPFSMWIGSKGGVLDLRIDLAQRVAAGKDLFARRSCRWRGWRPGRCRRCCRRHPRPKRRRS